jgi:Na+/H+-dicarboxylate symporter
VPGLPDADDPVATGTFAAVVAGATADDPDLAVEEPPTPAQSALAWARFAGELVLAVVVGVGTYFAFTVLWELMPYVAMVAAPLVLTALVAGVAAWRHRREQAQLGVRLLAVLVFAGTLLVIAPAAGLLAGR